MVAFLCYLITQFLLITKVLFLVGQAVEVEAEQGEAHHYLILRLLTVWAEVVGGAAATDPVAACHYPGGAAARSRRESGANWAHSSASVPGHE